MAAARERASRRRIHSVIRIRAASRASWRGVSLDIRIDGCLIRRRARSHLGFQSPLLLRAIDLAKIIDARVFLRRRARFDEVRDRDRGQQADDGDDDHDFYQREAGFFRAVDFHSTVGAV